MSQVRVRFAPSPTGNLHIGGARTALFNWLFAKKHQGKFLLRIEDTDRDRSEPRFVQDIEDSLKWLGLHWDEPIVFQSQKFARYQAIAEEMAVKNLAYRCDCTPDTLNAVRAQCEKDKKPFRYPGTCIGKTQYQGPTVIRMNIPKNGTTEFNDGIRGFIKVEHKDIDDWVMLRADGSPTYNFSVVVDDSDQGITHVLRGDDHINNTPKQILLYQALNLKVPIFAHLPMILGSDKQKLSKRHGAASTLEYRSLGYLPETLLNFIVRLGWSHGDQEVFTVEELCQYFDLDKIGKSHAVFNVDKLNWLSGHWLRETPAEKLTSYLKQYFQLQWPEAVDDNRLTQGISIIQSKVKTLVELCEQLQCLFGADPHYDLTKITPQHIEIAKKIFPKLEITEFNKDRLEPILRASAEEMGLKLTPVAQLVRLVVTGGMVSPGLFEMLEIQGKKTVLRRFNQFLKLCS